MSLLSLWQILRSQKSLSQKLKPRKASDLEREKNALNPRGHFTCKLQSVNNLLTFAKELSSVLLQP